MAKRSMHRLMQRVAHENLRMAAHPGIVFKDGPSGRRAAVACGPDVWELIKLLRELDESGEPAVLEAAELLALTEAKVRVALRYYLAYPDEIDRKIDEADQAAAEAKRAWDLQQQRRVTGGTAGNGPLS